MVLKDINYQTFLILHTLIIDNFYGSIKISFFISVSCSAEIYIFLINNNSKIRGIFFLAYRILTLNTRKMHPLKSHNEEEEILKLLFSITAEYIYNLHIVVKKHAIWESRIN